MAYESNKNAFSMVAAADLSAKQFFFVKRTPTGANLAAAITDVAIGVLQNKPEVLGAEASIYGVGSISKITAGAAFADGVSLMSDANGKAVLAAGAGAIKQGIAIGAAGGADELATILLMPHGKI